VDELETMVHDCFWSPECRFSFNYLVSLTSIGHDYARKYFQKRDPITGENYHARFGVYLEDCSIRYWDDFMRIPIPIGTFSIDNTPGNMFERDNETY
jgi:hypothetical protein